MRFEDVSVTYSGRRSTRALANVDMTVGRGDFVSLLGPSGCGKTTLLNMVAGLLPPSLGTVSHNGALVTGPNTEVGYMTQRDSVVPWRTTKRNIELPLELRGVGRKERSRRADETLSLVGLSEFASAYPSELSGGMRKRVSLAQMLVYEPPTMLLDEPFAALDAMLRMNLHDELSALVESKRITVLFVTHDMDEAVALSDRVVVMTTGPGRIKAVVDVDLPRPRRVRDVRASTRYAQLQQTVWSYLSDEVQQHTDQPPPQS